MTLFKKLIGVISLVALLLAFAPRDNDPVSKLVTALQKWTDEHPQEKVYLHMDKPYYVLGDTIWFKAYVTSGSRHELSAVSGALYVDLITEKDSIVKTLKLPIKGGMTMGDFTLEDNLREGNYRIRAYTQWMRNAGEDYFFDHMFIVGSVLADEVAARSDYQYKTVNGKKVLVATLAYTNNQGLPLSAEKIEYDMVINNQRVSSKSAKTNAQGSIVIDIQNEKKVDLRGAYIRTRIRSQNGKGKLVIKDFPIQAGLAQSDVQFFPEGGILVNGVSSKIAFKATGIDGKGTPVKGKILEDGNKEVLDFESLKFGMGNFIMVPVAGKAYSAKVAFEDGTEQTFPLPSVAQEGYVLSVYQPNDDSVLVRINISPKMLSEAVKKDTTLHLNLIAQSSGETVMATPLKIDRVMTSLWLEKEAFPSGIAQFTLFSPTGEPLNERIAFIKNKDQMGLKVLPTKNRYRSKEKIELELAARSSNDEPIAGNFSVSVIDESKVPFDEDLESTIFSSLLLSSDLKGYIEKPNYYFNNETAERDRALDNLMLTQGYRRFQWKEINHQEQTITDPGKAYLTNVLFKPEGLGIDISGVVKMLNGKVAPRAKLNLMSLKAGLVQSTTADAEGRFKFDGLLLRDSTQFTLQARNENNGDKVEIILDSVPGIFVSKNKNIADLNTNIPGTMGIYIENSRKQEEIYERTGQLDRVQRLREVRISATKKRTQGYAGQGMLSVPEAHADNSINMENEKPAANLGITLRALIPNVRFKDFVPDPNSPEVIYDYPHFYSIEAKKFVPMKVILDGRELRAMDAGGMFNNTTIDPSDVTRVDVVLTNPALLAILGGPSILVYSRKQRRAAYNPSQVNISPRGFNKVKTFYVPKYDIESNRSVPDFRSTVYWNADLKTHKAGKVKFNFFSADAPGPYKVIVEGISSKGELGRVVYRYNLDSNLMPTPPSKPIVNSQALFNINGTVKSEQSEPIESATVFLGGSTRVTKTDASGRFSFVGLPAGSYEVVIRMLGYASLKQNVLINSKNINKVMQLASQGIQLREVNIGKGSRRDEYLKTFFDTFIGVTRNAAFCTILNPEVIEFSTKGNTLQAFSDEFIIVKNKSLGYKISYLLRDFKYDRKSSTTIYDGECIFESLKGTDIEQKRWEKNRLKAYKGSFMHYLRSLYAGNTVEETFLTYVKEDPKGQWTDSLVDVRQYVSRANENFVNFSFNSEIKVVYAASIVKPGVVVNYIDPFMLAGLPTSNAFLFVPEAVIDKKGSYIDYKSFRLEGTWGTFRLGDQLPFEYMPK